ncbi:hypothetical protein GII30_22670 [Gordonia amarae]|uniref:EfeO-type cupredoxin-like domain-containing protein n=2 Tax=Gordonia amarae TaxID=36821 RepID=G7GLK3_9ACTN|nr:hypothetical protein [Gordonia amarae]MCS3876590.1 hypothetical protein [Gordonia amarae]QHN19482.1 hypothetical protein GII35_23135 [Gordonia amarae]QHN23958.1 hypothetical protein GII34_22635 [Gordonia amarae]QHN32867.1 hypothetical protein GII32_22965 [Gordonia amarae]QHN41586.1 hypothetical protein GII30_22670 [Gordonia amarae]
MSKKHALAGFAGIAAIAGILGAGAGTAAAVAPTTHLESGHRGKVVVVVSNPNAYPIECETWVVEKGAIGKRFTVDSQEVEARTLRGTPGYHEVWLHCGKNTLAGPDEVRGSIGLVKIKRH